MSPLSTCNLKIHFEFVSVNDACMTATIQIDDFISNIGPNNAGIFIFDRDIVLPTKVQMEFSGKDMAIDTICDPHGKILQDKCVIIRKILLDGFAVDRYYLQKKLTLHEKGSDRTNRSNYIGFNGTMLLDLDRPNVFLQIQKMSRMGKFDHTS